LLALDIFAGDVGVGGEGGLEMKVFEGSLSVGMSFVFDIGGLDGRSVVLEARKSLAVVQGCCRRRLLFACLSLAQP